MNGWLWVALAFAAFGTAIFSAAVVARRGSPDGWGLLVAVFVPAVACAAIAAGLAIIGLVVKLL